MQEELNNLKRELEILKDWKRAMGSSSSIPLDVDRALKTRFLFSIVKSSTKSASSENQSVAESGAATYNVLKPPDAFLQVQVIEGGTTYYIPVFT